MAASAFLLDSSERPKHPLLKPKPIRLGKSTPLSSLIKDRLASSAWLATMQTSMANPFEVLTYFRPSNQLVLLLQKGTDFPVYPPELAECIDEKTWYERMGDLEKALARYWSWVEKALFAFAFIASVTVPWPLISVASRLIEPPEDASEYEDNSEDLLSSVASAAASAIRSSSSASPSSTVSSAVRAATAMVTSLARRQLDRETATHTSTDDGFISSGINDFGDDDGELWPGYQSWADGYSSDLRWAAIGILIGVVIAVWLPWFIVTVRNSRRLRYLVQSWNSEDSKRGPMKALSWTIDKAPAFSNAKFLVIGLPPCLHQASVFDANAYPPMYGIGAQPHTEMNSLPDYHARGYQSQDAEKEACYVPPQAIAEQKVHVASGEDVPQTASDQLQRINSARHSLPPVRRDSLTSNHNYESSDDAVSIAYGANGGDRRASNAASIHSVGSRRGSVSNDNSALSGLTRPERSSSKSSRMSGRIL